MYGLFGGENLFTDELIIWLFNHKTAGYPADDLNDFVYKLHSICKTLKQTGYMFSANVAMGNTFSRALYLFLVSSLIDCNILR